MAIWDEVAADDYQELRLAVVMNGGVSLAIWIGGVASELNRLTESNPDDGSCYGALLEMLRSKARVDVLAGTSAGGINAAFLALGAVYGVSLKPLGELWAEAGGLTSLMRNPLDRESPSLLRGDTYFLPQLQRAFRKLISDEQNRRRRVRPPADIPIDLTITTSLIDGRKENFVDDFGTRIEQMQHKGQFHFVRNADRPADPLADPRVAEILALASRSTASFPFAFEASYVPVSGRPVVDHPNIATSIVNFDRNKFVLDGGVLLNMPVEPALRAIFQQPASGEVRRVMTYVNPDPGMAVEAEPAKFRKPPQIGQVLASAWVKLPAAQTISQALNDLQANNHQARLRKQLRPDLLEALGGDAQNLAARLFASYRRVRVVLAAQNIAKEVLAGERDRSKQDGDTGRRAPDNLAPPEWTTADIAAAFDPKEPAGGPILPVIPNDLKVSLTEPWKWGLAPVERLGIVSLDILRKALFVAPFNEHDLRSRVRERRGRIHGHLAEIRHMRRQDSEFWRSKTLPDVPENSSDRRERIRNWAFDQAREQSEFLLNPGDGQTYSAANMLRIVVEISSLLIDAWPDLRSAAGLGMNSTEPLIHREAEQLAKMLDTLSVPSSPAPGSGEKSASELLVEHLLSVEVCYMALTGDTPAQEQEVELMQISANVQHNFGGPGTAKEKLAGVQLNHFGAFYKKSWRVNDWTWGRLDGALRLVEATLSPRRMRQLGLHVDAERWPDAQVQPFLMKAAVGGRAAGYLENRFDREWEDVKRELSFLDDPELPVPPSVPFTAGVIARRLYVDILDDELGRLADAVEYDVRKGADKASSGVIFRDQYLRESGGRRNPELNAEVELSLFANSNIGMETIVGEKGTDLFAETTSRAAAVATSVVNAKGVGPAQAILRPVRALTLLLYALVYGAARGSRIGSWFVNAVLATGGALVAIAILDPETAGAIKALAALIVVSGFALAALRSQMLLLSLILAVLVAGAVLAGIYFAELERIWGYLVENQAKNLTILGLVIALGGLGYLRNPHWPRRVRRRVAKSLGKPSR